jgi:hypothetical protein
LRLPYLAKLIMVVIVLGHGGGAVGVYSVSICFSYCSNKLKKMFQGSLLIPPEYANQFNRTADVFALLLVMFQRSH